MSILFDEQPHSLDIGSNMGHIMKHFVLQVDHRVGSSNTAEDKILSKSKHHPAEKVLPLSNAACNVTPIVGDRVHKCAEG